MITFGLVVKGLFAKTSSPGTAVMDALVERMTLLMKKLEDHIKFDKLSGQVLSADSGALRDSIQALPVVVQGNDIIGAVMQDQSIAPYGPVQELGGISTYAINPVYSRAESRRIGRGTLQSSKVLHFLANGKDVFVRYAFHPPLPPRSFMVSALEDMRLEIEEGLRDAIFGAINE